MRCSSSSRAQLWDRHRGCPLHGRKSGITPGAPLRQMLLTAEATADGAAAGILMGRLLRPRETRRLGDRGGALESLLPFVELHDRHTDVWLLDGGPRVDDDGANGSARLQRGRRLEARRT